MQMTSAQVRAAHFTATKFREGYDQDQVDDFLDRIATELDARAAGGAPTLSARDVLDARFTETKFRPGYDQDQVDDFLDRVVRAMQADPATALHEAGGPVDAATVHRELAGFRTRRMRPGYDPAAVAEHLVAAAHELDHRARGFRPARSADDLAQVALPRTWWAPGYDRAAVDRLVERVVATLRA